ncbi:MAG: hypothetical protein HZA28_07495 [Candidatus Omnitrophica bacterium]|nr:hypothetical protein [Candidatus Omnitrophota bacterium]
MLGWLSIFIGLLGGLIAIAPIQGFVRFLFPAIRDSHLNNIRIMLVIIVAIIGGLGLFDRMKSEQEQILKRAAQFTYDGSLIPGACMGGRLFVF